MSQDTLPLHTLATPPLNVEAAVRQRYSAASRQRAADLCCPVSYDASYLAALPAELIERDYGCGDPSKHVQPGETVLDLGSGGGICYIAAQIVGPRGQVIGVDCNDEMLALARQYQRPIGDRLGYHNTQFYKGRIQDLALDLDVFERYLAKHPVRSASDWLRADEHAQSLRQTQPMIPDDSIDVVVSNCVLNLVRREDRARMFAEIFRVLRPGGRAVISDITSGEPVPERLQQDATLWSGCISGAFVEGAFVAAFATPGFHGMRIIDRQQEPWATVEGIEFRSLTVEAYKGACQGQAGPSQERRHSVIYRGPWMSVTDDRGQVLRRGERTAVSDDTFDRYARQPYAGTIIPVTPIPIPPQEAMDTPLGTCCGPSGCS